MKIKDENPSIKSTRQMRTSKHNPKKKQKQTINKNQVKTYAKRTRGYKMTINENKENLRRKSCHLPQISWWLVTEVHQL
jgi:hypothetical protein